MPNLTHQFFFLQQNPYGVSKNTKFYADSKFAEMGFSNVALATNVFCVQLCFFKFGSAEILRYFDIPRYENLWEKFVWSY